MATDRRRARQLEIQRKRRRDMSNHARKLAMANLEGLEKSSGPLVSAFDVPPQKAADEPASSTNAMSIDLPSSFGSKKGAKGRKELRGQKNESRKAFILKHRAKCKFYRSQLMTPEVLYITLFVIIIHDHFISSLSLSLSSGYHIQVQHTLSRLHLDTARHSRVVSG